jgi:ferrochelatase
MAAGADRSKIAQVKNDNGWRVVIYFSSQSPALQSTFLLRRAALCYCRPMSSKGLLLINLGTPEAPTAEKVRIYLKEFLMDPFVLDIPYPFRWLLVHGAILPKRPAASAEAYRLIWTKRGSPLMNHHLDLTDGVRAHLHASMPGGWQVEAGMRYGQPSIQSALEKFKAAGILDIHVAPLYPQYSLAATKSSLVEARKAALRVDPLMKLQALQAFYNEPGFLDVFAGTARKSLQGYDYDHLLFSFHGLPERHVKKTDRTGSHCLVQASCCERITEANQDCYRAQCFATARGIAQRMGLPAEKYSICFQSRLGKTPWIQPFTDELYATLPKKGIKRIAVMCPAFVADCLETLEEIQIRGRADFIARGGEDLKLVPSLNCSSDWVQVVAGFFKTAQWKPLI